MNKTENESWRLVNFLDEKNGAADIALKSLFKLYLLQANELSKLFSSEDMDRILGGFEDISIVQCDALTFSEVSKKLQKEA